MAEFGYVEDSIRQYIVEIINEVIKQDNLPFERADAQLEITQRDQGSHSTRKFPDIVIWKKGRVLEEGALLLELKTPLYPPLTVEVVEDAFLKASKVNIRYFATSNMQDLVLFDSFEQEPLMNRRKSLHKLTNMKSTTDILREDIHNQMKHNLRNFLLNFTKIFEGLSNLPRLPVDEFFIYNLRQMVDSLSFPFTKRLIQQFKNDIKFQAQFKKWFVEQGWMPPLNSVDYYDDFERSSRQYLYLLANKIMFYFVMRQYIPTLSEIALAPEYSTGQEVQNALYNYFDIAEKESQDYETIFGMNFIERFPIPDEGVDSLRRFINGLSKHNFTSVGYADFGKIFDKLIPTEERHKLGQYFTTQRHSDGSYWPDIVDLIIGFTIPEPQLTILDGGCGAGTFLVRSYSRIKYLDPSLQHREILSRLYGADISKFPSLLSSINLAIRDLSQKENYPIIINNDFFQLEPTDNPSLSAMWKNAKQRVLTLKRSKHTSVNLPKMGAFIGNPPYIRQEEIEEYIEDYKKDLDRSISKEWPNITIGKRSGIYVYFMMHGTAFLQEGRRLGYVTINSWLDVDYGKHLQKFLLENCKIIAIIESKYERWFDDPNVNPVITIAERCTNKSQREANTVRFVLLKKKLEEIIPSNNENSRWKTIDSLVNEIEKCNDLFEDDKLRIFPKQQATLWKEGLDQETGKYEGGRWGKYVRAPEIFFKILANSKKTFVPLHTLAEVRFGIKTGANEFFYLTDNEINKNGIEKRYFQPVIFTLKEITSYKVDPSKLKYKILLCHKTKTDLSGTHILRYIRRGEENKFHERPTCAARNPWYSLAKNWNYAPLIFPSKIGERMPIFESGNTFEDKKLYGVTPNLKKDTALISALLNSTISRLIIEYNCRQLTGAQAIADIDVAVVEDLLVPAPSKIDPKTKEKLEDAYKALRKTQSKSVFQEIAPDADSVTLPKVKPELRKIDEIVMTDILGLTNKEQLEAYKALVDFVKSRLEKAASVQTDTKRGTRIDFDKIVEDILISSRIKPLPVFPNNLVQGLDISKNITIPNGKEIRTESTLGGFYLIIDDERIECPSMEEALYLYWVAVTGGKEAPIPSDSEKMTKAVHAITREYEDRIVKIDKWMIKNIPNLKDRKEIRSKIIQKLPTWKGTSKTDEMETDEIAP